MARRGPSAWLLAVLPLLVLLPLLLLAACKSEEKGEAGKPITLGNVTFNDHGTKDVKGKAEVELEADSKYFNPTFLRGTPGQKLTLKIENESQDLHSFTLPAQQVDKDFPAKAKGEVAVTFPPSGVVRFFCKYHTGQGMNGELLAGDASPQPAAESIPASGTPPPPRGQGYSP